MLVKDLINELNKLVKYNPDSANFKVLSIGETYDHPYPLTKLDVGYFIDNNHKGSNEFLTINHQDTLGTLPSSEGNAIILT